MPVPLPIACSLESVAFEDRRQEWLHLLSSNLIDRTRTGSGVRLRLNSSPQVLDTLQKLIASENQCCPWISWSLVTADQESVLEISAETSEGIESLARMFGELDSELQS
ncbi:MAG TPA: hypothetical protein VNA87_01465, partial [Actinomycetota bacterium]|nr:hypothetical protein [Actinomycetota bacterium]